mgnify:CR=1 FL=1
MKEGSAVSEAGAAYSSAPSTPYPGYNKRLLAMLFFGNAALFSVYSALGGILVPSMIQSADPIHKVTSLALVNGVGAVFAMVLNPLGGAWSDHTRSRWGRRTPWLIGAALVTLLFSIFFGVQQTVFGILMGWCLAQGAGNVFQASLTAVVPDRVPAGKRGTASALAGLGTMLGALIGLGLGGAFIQQPVVAATLVGILLVVVAVLFVTLAPDSPFTEAPVARQATLAQSVRSFFSSLGDHDFLFAFLSRLLMVMGTAAVEGYYFYLLQDYIGITRYGLQPQTGVLILTAVSSVGALVTVVLGGVLTDRSGRRKAVVIGSAVFSALVMILPLIWPTWPVMIAFSALVGLAFGLQMSVGSALVTLVLPKAEDNARDLGILNIANAVPHIIAPFIAGPIIAYLGGYSTLFLWGIGFGLLGALAIVPIRGVK